MIDEAKTDAERKYEEYTEDQADELKALQEDEL